MKNVLIKLVSVAFLGLTFQAYGHDSKVTAEDIELAIKLGQQREACYRKLDKAPNDDYAVPESELLACMFESAGVTDPNVKVLQAVTQVIKRIDRGADDLSDEILSLAMAARELAAVYGVSSIDPAVIALDASLNEQQEIRIKQHKGVSNER